jgi:hypothetical protein
MVTSRWLLYEKDVGRCGRFQHKEAADEGGLGSGPEGETKSVPTPNADASHSARRIVVAGFQRGQLQIPVAVDIGGLERNHRPGECGACPQFLKTMVPPSDEDQMACAIRRVVEIGDAPRAHEVVIDRPGGEVAPQQKRYLGRRILVEVRDPGVPHIPFHRARPDNLVAAPDRGLAGSNHQELSPAVSIEICRNRLAAQTHLKRDRSRNEIAVPHGKRDEIRWRHLCE